MIRKNSRPDCFPYFPIPSPRNYVVNSARLVSVVRFNLSQSTIIIISPMIVGLAVSLGWSQPLTLA